MILHFKTSPDRLCGTEPREPRLLTRGNGTVTAYGYDAVSRLASLVQSLPGTSHDLILGFTYNPASQIATHTRSNDLFSYDGHANQNVTDTRDGLNRVTATGGTAIGYDSRHNIALVGTAAYVYNSENMLVSGGGRACLRSDAAALSGLDHALGL